MNWPGVWAVRGPKYHGALQSLAGPDRPEFLHGSARPGMKPAKTPAAAAKWLDSTGFALLMPHKTIPMPSLFEAIRGKTGGHPFRPWTKDSDLMWEFKDELPRLHLAFYGSIWGGKPGFCSLEMLPCLMKLWGCPPGPDGFRTAYREGALSFDANRIGELLIRTGPINTYNLRKRVGIAPNTFKRALAELGGKLIVAKCGKEAIAKIWEAEIVDLSARVFPKVHAEVRTLSFMAARESALETMREAAPTMQKKQLARLLRVGVE